MGVEIVGRAAEQAAIERFVAGVVAPDPVGAGPLGLAISGEAGIGKSSLWLRAVDAAREAGALVLETRPAAPDRPVSYSGFVDLLDAAVDDVLHELPGPQQVALEIALYRRAAGERPEAGIIGVASFHALRLLASRRPLIVAVDDVQWLDGASATAVGYAIRRLRDGRVGLVTARRVGPPEVRRAPVGDGLGSDAARSSSPEAAADELDALLPEERLVRLEPGPLPLGAVHHLVRTRLGAALPRPVIVSIHRRSAGNPFFALELARDWLANGEPTRTSPSRRATASWTRLAPAASAGSPGSSPSDEGRAVDAPRVDGGLPASLRDVLARRLDVLPAPSRRPLAIIAIAGHASIEVVAAVDGKPAEAVADALEPARWGGVVVELGDRLRIGHPLLAEAIIDAATAAERRHVHRRLASLAADPEERARHLAAIGNGPDRETAEALATAAGSAAARGATAAAVELYEAAVRHWPSADPIGLERIRFRLAERVFLAGDLGAAMAQLRALIPILTDPLTRADAEILLATLVAFDGSYEGGRAVIEEALGHTADPTIRGRMYARRAWMHENDLVAGSEDGRRAIALLDPAVDPGPYSFALMNLAATELQLGGVPDHAAIARGHEIQERARLWDYSSLPANWSKWFDDFDRSRELTETYIERARAMGDESSLAHLLSYLVELEGWTGRMDRAEPLSEEGVDVAEQTGQRTYESAAHARRALVRAIRGNLSGARDDVVRALELAAMGESPTLEALAFAMLAFTELSAEDLPAAAGAADQADAIVAATGMVEAPMFRYAADQIEAHIGLGHLDVAAALLDRLDLRQSIAPRPSLAATGGRCRALLLAARGDVPAALLAVDAALAAHLAVDLPLEAARTWLVAGQLRRRAGRRRAAASAFAEAMQRFEALGAAVWLARARRELAGLGLDRGPNAASSGFDSLTPAETRIAELAASGLTNRAVAERLLISPKTVEASLARAYAKLGIRSRAELGARFGREREDLSAGTKPA